MTDARYLLVKRGLYYRPNNNGYTGIKEHAGRYRDVDALGLDSVTAIHEDEAPEYSAACFEDLKCAHMQARIAALIEERDRLREEAHDGWERGMQEAANICGSLAETTYDDADAFRAAAGCEAEIINNLRIHQNNHAIARAALRTPQPEHMANLSASDAELIAQAQPLELPDERAAIVAWLRGPTFGSRHPEDAVFARHIADAIERGDHRK